MNTLEPTRSSDRTSAPRPSHRFHPETIRPSERAGPGPRRLLVAYGLALGLPVATALLMIPLRQAHGRTLAIVLVLPVVLVATLGSTGPSVLGAVVAGLSYDILLTAPYNHIVIDDPDDLAAAGTLVVVGLAVGVLTSRGVRLRTSDSVRHRELNSLVRFASLVADGATGPELTAGACQHLAVVLQLRHCTWQPGQSATGQHVTGQPTPGVAVLLSDGNVMGYYADLNPDRARLPDQLELPAIHGGHELGRFLLTPDTRHLVAYEQRRTAATIAALYASTLYASTL